MCRQCVNCGTVRPAGLDGAQGDLRHDLETRPVSRIPRLPLWTGKSMSVAEYRKATEEATLEREDQRRLVADLRNPLITNGKVLVFAVPNSALNAVPGVSKAIRARIWRVLERDGALAGATDLIILHNGRTIYVEMKRAKGGRLSPDQKRFRDDCIAAGGVWMQANG